MWKTGGGDFLGMGLTVFRFFVEASSWVRRHGSVLRAQDRRLFSHFLMQGFQTFQRLRKTQFAFLSLHKAQLDMRVLSSAQRGKN